MAGVRWQDTCTGVLCQRSVFGGATLSQEFSTLAGARKFVHNRVGQGWSRDSRANGGSRSGFVCMLLNGPLRCEITLPQRRVFSLMYVE
jgi:hypothetical protein